ncbi:kinase-like domain-containing protein [Lenzites betulinus]|nr:kinase-like domain-containing protein [Lenzites betulinus]
MSLILLWNSNGEKEELTPMPESFQRWVATDGGEPPEDDWRPVLHAVETALSRKIVQLDSRSIGLNLVRYVGRRQSRTALICPMSGEQVLDTKYVSGEQNIVRSPIPETPGRIQGPGSIDRFWREVHLMKWLKAHTALPVPTIHCVIDVHEPEVPRPIVVMDKKPGITVLNSFGRMPYSVKEQVVRAYAEKMLELFRLDVPQRIGSPQCSAEGTQMEVIPLIAVSPTNNATQLFDTLEDWLAALVAARARSDAIGTDPAERREGERVLARLAAEFSAMCARLARPALRRCVLVHDDLNHSNILVDAGGDITGIIDWEYASIRPAVMAADYPDFLRYDGVADPALESNKNSFWLASPQDAATLRTLYLEVVKAKDEEYWEALVEGAVLRNTYDWVTTLTVDPGCAALERWMDKVFAHD